MSYCDLKKDGLVAFVIVFLSLGLVIPVLLAGTVLFFHKWFTLMTEEQRKTNATLVCAVIVTFAPLERSLRLLEFYLRYYGSRFSADLAFQLNTVLVSVPGTVAALLILQVLRLEMSFKGTAFEVPKPELQRFWFLVLSTVLAAYGTGVGLGFLESHPSKDSPIIIGSVTGFAAMLAGITLCTLDFAFARRLRGLVAMQTIMARPMSVSPEISSNHTINSDNDDDDENPNHNAGRPRGASQLSDVPHHQAIGTLNAISMDDNETVIINQTQSISPDTSDDRPPTLDVIRKKSTLQSFRKARISDTAIDTSQAQILRAASKHTVIALWCTWGLVFCALAMLLFAMANCADWIAVIGHCLFSLGILMCAIPTVLSIGQSDKEYRSCCIGCDVWVSKIIAFRTDRNILDLTVTHQNSHPPPQLSNLPTHSNRPSSKTR